MENSRNKDFGVQLRGEKVTVTVPRVHTEQGQVSESLEGIIAPGSVSLIEQPQISFDVLKTLTETAGYQGLVIARMHPARHRCNGGTEVYWLTQAQGPAYINPNNIPRLNIIFDSFVSKPEVPKAVILVEGVEYLATQNDFGTAYRLLDRWAKSLEPKERDGKVMRSQARLILAYDPLTLTSEQLHSIRKLGANVTNQVQAYLNTQD